MSLAEQSQQWFPTSVQVTVHQARDLRTKGKHGTNDAYAIMQVAKDKFSTSVAEKTTAPVWKEEATFDLPLFHPGNAERCTLEVVVMHRAQVGLDKFLGQAVINLLELYDNKNRKKLDWYRMVDKSGKQDKDRGEVLLDIQFMRNNLSASMFDLSMQEKPRSRISKLKDKVRGKKKDSFSDSASAIVPPVSQVLTDSDGEADAQSLNLSSGEKKKSKLKKLFTPKSNLHRNISQSMSTLGTLPEKNSSLSGSRSSGLNVDSPEVKKKFKFLGHKRTGSSDSKGSQGPFSLLSRSKHSNTDINSLCVNGSHVYAEDTEAKTGSTLSLNSSGQGSMEDIRKHTADLPADSSTSVAVPSFRNQSQLEQQHHQEEEERRQAEERRIAETRRQEQEEKYRAEARRLQEEEERRQREEQERKKRFLEDEARRKKQREEEEEEERRVQEEERHKAEEQKRQEEASMSDRLTSLFGMIRKKEDKKEELPQETRDHLQTSSNVSNQTISHHSTNPFQDIPLGSNESPTDQNMSSLAPQAPSAMSFLNRNAKVSAVKPRLPQSLDSEPPDSPINTEFIPISLPSESPESFSNLHSSLAPPNISRSPSISPCVSTENLSAVESESDRSEGSGELSPTMADQRKRAILPPLYSIPEATGNSDPVREFKNPAYVEPDGLQDKKLSLPLPDYETLFPQKRHGVQGQTKWDHLIAEVNQRHRELPPQLLGPEMSVDGPEEREPSFRSSVSQESPAVSLYRTHSQHNKPVSPKKAPAPAPPKPERSLSPEPDLTLRQSPNAAYQSPVSSTPSAVPTSGKIDPTKLLSSSRAPATPRRPSSQTAWETASSDDEKKAQLANKDTPTAKPRQRVSGKEPLQQERSAVNSNRTSPTSSISSTDNKEGFQEFDPFPTTDLLSKDPWTSSKQNQKVMDPFPRNVQKEEKPEDRGMTTDDLNNIFNQEKTTDPFTSFSGSDSNKSSPYSLKDDVSKQFSAAFQRKNSQKGRKSLPSPSNLDNKSSQSQPVQKEDTTLPTANQDDSNRYVTNPSITLQPQADGKTQSNSYGVEDPFGTQPFSVPTALMSSEPFPVVTEEAASEAESSSGEKPLLRAWVSPSEVQPVSTQNSNGSGLVLSARRPHAVKPLSPAERQFPASSPAVKEIKLQDNTAGKIKVADSGESGPYTQLTQEELITLVVKQQTDLSVKDAKIVELEEYIDNLLVRVIEEKPSILYALNAPNPV